MILTLKVLFYLASASSLGFTVLSITAICLCLFSFKKAALIVGALSTLVYAIIFHCIWANLILRLFVAFRDSVYKMTTREKVGYLTVFVFLSINALATSTCQLLILLGQRPTPSIWIQFALGILFMAVFSISALCAVCSFSRKLLILSKAQTMKQTKAFREEEPIALNKKQEKLVNLSSKYVSLFLVASLSSFVTLFSGVYETSTNLRISIFLVPIDCAINLICIYLQYAFAGHQYNRYCSKFDWSCKKVITARWVQAIHTMRREERDIELAIASVKEKGHHSQQATGSGTARPTPLRQKEDIGGVDV